MPVKAAGWRIDPPVSVPVAAGAMRAATTEDEPPEDEPDDLLGLYDGVALTERDSSLMPHLPDRIFLFRGPLLDMCEDVEELTEEIRITVVHEVAHHFGIDDDRLHDLGYA